MDEPAATASPAPADCRFGWYGKLPSLGDFGSRRLPAELIEGWDAWLAAGIAGWREREPDSWLQAYLSGSSWRFVALPGTLPGSDPARALAGVLMPSVDRVGRYFPFTVMWQVDRLPQSPAALESLLRVLQDVDDLALDALQEDWPVDTLEAELQRLDSGQQQPSGERGPALAQVPGHGSVNALDSIGDLASQFGVWGAQSLIHHWHGCVIWLSDPGTGKRELRITHGLPEHEAFAQLLGGNAAAASSTAPPASGAGASSEEVWD